MSQRLVMILSADSFGLYDLKDISEVMNVDWASLTGNTAADKARSLVERLEQAGMLDKRKKIVTLRGATFRKLLS